MSGPIIIPSGGGGGGSGTTTRKAYRRAIGYELGRFAVFTVTSAASTSSVPDAPRSVFLTSLQADGQGVSRFDGSYLYVVTGAQAGQQRRIVGGSWMGRYGHVFVDAPFSSALAAGSEVEIGGVLPSSDHLDTHSLNRCVNDALARVLIETRLALTGNGTRSISLASETAYLLLGDQVDAIYERQSTTAPYELGTNEATIETDGIGLTLILDQAITAGTAFQARILRPGDTLIKTSGTWGTSTTGLTDDAQEAAAPLDWIRTFGMVKALQHAIVEAEADETLSDAVRDRRIAAYSRRRLAYVRAAVRIVNGQFPTPTPKRRAGVVEVSGRATWAS